MSRRASFKKTIFVIVKFIKYKICLCVHCVYNKKKTISHCWQNLTKFYIYAINDYDNIIFMMWKICAYAWYVKLASHKNKTPRDVCECNFFYLTKKHTFSFSAFFSLYIRLVNCDHLAFTYSHIWLQNGEMWNAK